VQAVNLWMNEMYAELGKEMFMFVVGIAVLNETQCA
jgi:hypothetical protein